MKRKRFTEEGASASKCWWLPRNPFSCSCSCSCSCSSLSLISRDAVLSTMPAGLTTRCLTFKDVFVCTPTYLFGVRRHRQAN